MRGFQKKSFNICIYIMNCSKTTKRSLLFFGDVFLELVLGTLFGLGQILKQPDNIGLQQPKPLSTTDSNLLLLNILKLVDPVANIHPAPGTGVLNDRVFWVFFRSHFVYGLPVPLYNLAFVFAPKPLLEHRCVSSKRYVPDGKQVVLRVVVGIGGNYARGLKN